MDGNGTEDSHLEQHLSTANLPTDPSSDGATASSAASTGSPTAATAVARTTRSKARSSISRPTATATSTAEAPAKPRRSARLSISEASNAEVEQNQPGGSVKEGQDPASVASASGKRKRLTSPSPTTPVDRKGKKKASPPSSPLTDIEGDSGIASAAPPAKRTRQSLRGKAEPAEAPGDQGKGKAKAKSTKSKMPRKSSTPKNKRGGMAGSSTARPPKGTGSAKGLIDNDTTDEGWANESGPSRSRYMDEDDDMEGSDHDNDDDDEDEDEDEDEGMGGIPGGSAFARFNQLAAEAGMHIDEGTAAALFGSGFRSMGNMMSGLNNRFKRLRSDLKSKNISTRLAALRECSEVLLVSNEDTLGGSFSTQGFATEFIAILKGSPNDDDSSSNAGPSYAMDIDEDDMDEDAQLARALAMSTEGAMPPSMGMDASEEEMECQLVACRCLAHLLEALPGTGHTLVHLGAVPVLCSKLNEPSYIELAEQTLSTMEKISAEYPSAIVREGGLEALLRFLDFFSTNVQRTAVTAAANCCRNISSEHYGQIKEVFPTLRQTLTQTDQRLVEQATLAVVRVLESYRHNAEHLEGLLSLETVVAINALLVPSGGSPLISPSTYTHLLRSLTSSARVSAKVTIAFLEAGMTNTVYQILTGVLPPAHDEDEQGMSPGGQGLAGGVADMAVLQNLAHRPKDQVEEALALICELLPPTPREGVFDSKAYSEKALHNLKKAAKGNRPDPPVRRSSRALASATGEGSATESPTPAEPAAASSSSAPPMPAAIQAALKQKKEQEALNVKRLALLKEQNKLVDKFIRAILPVLVDVYAASVAARVRTKVLNGLVKAVAFAEPDELRRALQSVPMASFLGTIISSKDNPTFILSALQLVELLVTKLPEIYKPSFVREGVVFEIQALAQGELTSVAAAREAKEKKATEEAKAVVKTEPDSEPASSSQSATASSTRARDPTSAMPGSFMSGVQLDDLKPLLSSSGMPTRLAEYILDKSASAETPAKKYNVPDPQDINILRARVMLMRKLFETEQGADEGTAVLDKLSEQVKRLCSPSSSESDIRDTLRDIAGQFSDPSRSLSSFELLQSGLIDGLLEFSEVKGVVNEEERRNILYEEFADAARPANSPLVMLVKRLHESLGRLETFDVETAFNGVADTSRSSSTLSRTMRIRLQAEEGQDVPKNVAAISITIQAVCPIAQLNDYLHQRVLNGNNYLSGGASALASMLGFGSGGFDRPGSGSGGQGLLGALGRASEGGTSSAPAGTSAPRGAASSLPERGSLAAMLGLDQSTAGAASRTGAAPASQDSAPAPQRRRSARLSAQGGDTAEAGTSPETGSSAPNPSRLLSMLDDAPTGGAEALFGGMGMDMDFDDGYSDDDDYDAEIFEDDMEEDLVRPQEKVVNMSVAPDGSKVEAKTPDGTRVATPSQNPASAAAGSATPTARPPAAPAAAASTSASGAATPRTASYAGAVKTAPTDWHLEFTYDGKPITYDDTVYGVVHRAQANKAQSHAAFAGAALPGSMGSFGATAVFRYKKVPGPAPADTADAPSPASEADALLTGDVPTTKILRLLRLVHDLVADGREAAEGRMGGLDEALFVNNKLTAKLTRQLEETMIVASNCLPSWATVLPKHFAFLFPFETRYSFLQNNSFGYSRLIQRHQAAQQARAANNPNRRDDLSHLARILRQKVRISRAQLLESAAKVLELYGVGKSVLEVEYFDEIGTGLGPTLEFYSLASKEFARRSLGLWRDDDEAKEGSYVYHARGLFPAPMVKDDTSRLSWYKTLGIFIGRALIDSRIIDVTLNKVFLKLILGIPVRKSIATLRAVDPLLARSLERLQAYSAARKEIESLQLPELTKHQKLAALTVHGAQLSELALDFTLPGYNIELKPGGGSIDVDDSNLEEYLELVLDKTVGSGVAEQVKAFQDGFSLIYPIRDMRIFSPEELVLLFGNADEDWSSETIEHSIKADHGYNLDSRSVRNLIEVMSSYTKDERRQFLQFITGAPKLPIGGFRGLNPPFTVVRKPHEAPFRADDYLPSVMTCAQYLKLPDYSNKEVLAKQVERAILDGGGSFHLS